MKRFGITTLTALIAVLLIASLVRDASEAVRHFWARPRDLLGVAGLAMLGGLGALVFGRLPARAQGNIRVLAWGVAASCLTPFVAYGVFRLASLSPLVIDSKGTGWVVLGLLSLSAVTMYLWFEFWRAWKRRVS